MRWYRHIIASLIIFISFIQIILAFSLFGLVPIEENNIFPYNSQITRNHRKDDTPLDWPPFKMYIYPNKSRHTTDCLFPPELPTRYINETGFWFQRMLEPTTHAQFLKSPIITDDPSSAEIFFVPHYSRMCSGLDEGVRWNEIPEYLRNYGGYFYRYSSVDHFIMHSVPHYGDKPADKAAQTDRAPQIGILDFEWNKYIKKPWTLAKSTVMPFITLKTENHIDTERKYTAFVAMAFKKLNKQSAVLRKQIKKAMDDLPNSIVSTIYRGNTTNYVLTLDLLPKMMSQSQFCVVPPGDAPSSKRFFDAISNLCIPLLLSDHFTLPYEDTVAQYEKCVVQIPSDKVEELTSIVKSYSEDDIFNMREELAIIRERFTWDYKKPPKEGQGLWTLSWALYDKHRMLMPYNNNELTGFDDDPPIHFTPY